jgi:hypothetical protein
MREWNDIRGDNYIANRINIHEGSIRVRQSAKREGASLMRILGQYIQQRLFAQRQSQDKPDKRASHFLFRALTFFACS